MTTVFAVAQEKASKADVYFFEYKFKAAITEYQKEKRENPLTSQQTLNLADSYLKTGNFNKAIETYMEVFQTDDVMQGHYYNRMLQAMSVVVGRDSTRNFLKQNRNNLDPILMENADFNFSLLEKNDTTGIDFRILNVNGNSSQSDFAPTFYKDQILFTSARPQESKKIYDPSGESYLDIFSANSDDQGNLNLVTPFKGVPNSAYHQGTPYYSEELDAVFYVRTNEQAGELVFDENGKNTLALGSSDRSGNFRFLLKDLSTSFYYPFYDAASGKLYFAANFEDSMGGTDLYYVYTNNGLIMSSPINLGPRINTPGNEIAPYIFEGSLYFASDVFYGLGGMDTYKSEILEDNIYSIPVNLGKGLNSEKDDFGFIIKNYQDNSLIGYFSSNRPGGKGNDDIYGFIIKDKPGIKTFTLSGSVLNLTTNESIPQAEV
ncbi:MAG: OmpA family protein, partial [Flavobacteriaceae bacterium]|nr:OmpA family protein [Flavobacteriaceae bacterium]